MTSARVIGVLAVAATIVAASVDTRAQPTARRPAVRLDPATAIFDAFTKHPVVALGEGAHGNEQGHLFRLGLIRDPRFAGLVDDIVVEHGSATFQGIIDRFVRGEAVPDTTLRDLTENTVTPTPAWDRPMYQEFFRAVRDLNRTLPAERQLRVLLGDPPIDWTTLAAADEYRKILLQRDAHPADVIRREVLAKGRRALVVYGDGHFQARTERPGRSLVGILETSGITVFSITTTFGKLPSFQPDVASWQTPGLALLKGTHIGAAPYEAFFGPPPPVDYFKANPNIEDHYDAVLYLGAASSMTIGGLAYPRCADPAYVEMRVGRMVLVGMAPSVRDRLAGECAAAAPQ